MSETEGMRIYIFKELLHVSICASAARKLGRPQKELLQD